MTRPFAPHAFLAPAALLACLAALLAAGPALAQTTAPANPDPDAPQLPHSFLLDPLFKTLNYGNAQRPAPTPQGQLQSYGNGIAVQPVLPPPPAANP